MKTKQIRIFRYQSPVKVLGFFSRAVIWVQGCKFACTNCIVPESWDLEEGGESISLQFLADWILTQKGIEGVTFSGGEPMLQAEELSNLIDIIKLKKDLGVVCYTGYTLENLVRHGSQYQKLLLSKIDLLIDGLYKEELHSDLRWRGSKNQRLLPLTNRYKKLVQEILKQDDSGCGLEFFVDNNGILSFNGVPNQPNFREMFEQKMSEKGIKLPSD
ncbi:MAG: radical SAM protein [Cyanobacteria bacterium]|nr:radical SAM protein [Cyanobacteria bacterium CG_2015-16_32_12]NCO77575.1 radical SAM protein [Cyanobacteria bacterium CG_2015-22_32_23]NCQ04754.1 radical SAM protein [Cyanobacteria bacterium CG_2015-09_32_10]NCQ42752.1 radical SAM protein [Cyanobacteria bacterium CG_2015-04_32_10]NCS84610.1 radical SAM protein [Cyanobacteria bacterium CG_2015-02_32_10]